MTKRGSRMKFTLKGCWSTREALLPACTGRVVPNMLTEESNVGKTVMVQSECLNLLLLAAP